MLRTVCSCHTAPVPASKGQLHAAAALRPPATARTRHHLAARAGPGRQAEQAAENTKEASKGLLGDLAGARQRLLDSGVSPGDVSLRCGLIGITLGWLFQITHNVGYLPVYDVQPFNLGPFPEAGTIPIVLAPIWLLYGYATPVLDEYVAGLSSSDSAAVDKARTRGNELSTVLLFWGLLAAHLLLSDAMYQAGLPHLLHHAVLAPLALALWKAFDDTKGGLALGSLLTVGAPVGEMLIVNLLGWWHYERPELFGVPTWAGWCYFGYAVGIAYVARYFAAKR